MRLAVPGALTWVGQNSWLGRERDGRDGVLLTDPL
jgi:hypothetical protein